MDPLDEVFWNEQREKLYNILLPIITAATVNAARSEFERLTGIAEIGIGWDVVNEQALGWAAVHTEAVVSKITDTSMKAFVQEFESWVQSGDPTSVLIEKLAPYYGEVRAEMIAVTETTRAYARGNVEFWKETGLVSGFEWRTAEDDAVCVICNGKEDENPYSIDADTPPAHVRCLPGSTLVSSIGGISAGSKRWYEGDMVTIRTSKNSLSVTPNHPILTSRGWVPAGEVNKFDHVFADCGREWESSLVKVDDEHRVSSIEDVFSAFSFSGFRVPLSPPDFHGDAGNSKVAVIRSNSVVVDGLDTIVAYEPSGEGDFLVRDVDEAPLPAYSTLAEFSEGNFPALSRCVSCGNLLVPSGVAHSLPLDTFSLGLSSDMDIRIEKALSESPTIDTGFFSELIFGLAGRISLDEVVEVRNDYFSGHVYNLQTESGLYVAEGIITHNCRCWLTPILE